MCMPYKDPKKHREFVRNSYIAEIKVRIRQNDSAFCEALTHAANASNITTAEYLRISAKEKLAQDGYLSDE